MTSSNSSAPADGSNRNVVRLNVLSSSYSNESSSSPSSQSSQSSSEISANEISNTIINNLPSTGSQHIHSVLASNQTNLISLTLPLDSLSVSSNSIPTITNTTIPIPNNKTNTKPTKPSACLSTFHHNKLSSPSFKPCSGGHRLSRSNLRLRKTTKKGSLSYSTVSFHDRRAKMTRDPQLPQLPHLTSQPPVTPLSTSQNNHILNPQLLPPINVDSLREIELQEIIKNPQLRHDIVFDPQLQFRPNMDGERGRRKKVSTELYWDSVVAECEALAAVTSPAQAAVIVDNPNSKLKVLFVTLRDILDTLLPAKDRDHVGSVLDPELLVQQLRQCVLDFSALANWLSMIFKAHCAPMRDSWVDQMVARIEDGVKSKSSQRIVEGLRMMFAILEAMKLDVANHQIRTLRPVMVENAVEFELDYYTRMIEKGKFLMHDSLQWYSTNLSKYVEKKQQQLGSAGSPNTFRRSLETYRSAFVHDLVKLLSCASEESSLEFPTSFAFDFIRLANFKAEVRQIVCLNICILHYSQLLRSQLGKKKSLNKLQREACLNAALSRAHVEQMKRDILAIVGDGYGNSKWTKNIGNLALELSKRIELACTPGFGKTGEQSYSAVPPKDLVDLMNNMFIKNMQPGSPVYCVVESKIIGSLMNLCCRSMNTISALDNTPTLANQEAFVIRSFGNGSSSGASSSTMMISSDPETVCQQEVLNVASKLLVLLYFHWEVFSKFYIQYAATNSTLSSKEGNEEEVSSVQSSSSVSDNEQPIKRAKNSQEANVLKTTADNEITL